MASGKVFVPAKTTTTQAGGKVFVPSAAKATAGPGAKVFVPVAGKKKSQGAHGIGGLVENLAGDVKDTITGLPRGLVETVQHPIRVAEQVGKSYKDTYGPILNVSALDLIFNKGDARHREADFLRQVYAHPLGPILDVATVATLGAGSVAKAGTVLSKAGLIAETSRLAKLSELRTIELRSPRVLAAEGKVAPGFADLIDQTPGVVLHGRTLSRNPLIRARQEFVDAALKRLPATTPRLGEISRYGRELDKSARRTAFTRQNEIHRWHTAYRNLNKDERVALDLIARGLTPEEWKGVLLRSAENVADAPLRRFVDKTVKVLDRPKLAELVASPSKNLVIAHEEARRLSEAAAAILHEHGLLTPDAANERLYLHKRIASGARLVDTPNVDVGQLGATVTDRLQAELRTRPRTTAEARTHLQRMDTMYDRIVEQTAQRLGLIDESGKLAPDQVREQLRRNTIVGGQKKGRGKQLRKGRQQSVRAEALAQAEDELHAALNANPDAPGMAELRQLIGDRERIRDALEQPLFGGATNPEHLGTVSEQVTPEGGYQTVEARGKAGWEGGQTPEEIQAALDAQGHLGLVYLPDRMVRDYVANPALARHGGGLAGKQNAIVHQNKAVLFQAGRLALGQDTLSPAFLRAVKYALFDDLHTMLEEGAVKIPVGQGLPPGWRLLPRKLIGKGGKAKGERFTYTDRNVGQYERELEHLIPDPGKEGETRLSADQLMAKTADDALVTEDGFHLMIPEALAKQVAGEFTRSGKAIRVFIEKPTQVWRAIILGYRPGFLVNNVVGNSLMLAIHFAGPSGLASLVDAIRTSQGHATAEHALRDGVRSGKIDKAFINEFHPEFAGAVSFAETQMPRFGPRGTRIAEKAKVGLLPATQKASETFMRKVGVGAAIRKNPDVRRIRQAMPRQTRSWRAAAEKAYEQDPRLVREVSDQVNAALGDYLALSAAERSYVRAAIPFWAWYRTILTITAKLPLEHPGRALILTKLGQVGADLQPEDVPSYLQGALPFGGPGSALLGEQGGAGTQTVLSTAGINPFQTVVQVGTAARQLAVGDPGSAASTFGGELNPFLQAFVEQLTGKTLFSGGDVHQGPVPGLAGIPVRTALNLPQVQIFTGGPSKLYPERDPRAQLLAALGVPVKRYSKAEAASRGR